MGAVLADFYQQGLTIEEAVEQAYAISAPPAVFEPVTLEPELPEEEPPGTVEDKPVDMAEAGWAEYEEPSEEPDDQQPETPTSETDSAYPSVAEVLSLTGTDEPEE
jgi:hypothetical protein